MMRTRLLATIAALIGMATATTSALAQTTERFPRPETVFVYPFASYNSDIPAQSAARTFYEAPSVQPSGEELDAGRQLGAMVANRLADSIRNMGLNASVVTGASAPKPNDAILVGYFEAADEGSAAKRLIIGFGAGAANMRAVVEGYWMTENGPRLIDAGVASNRSAKKTPGILAPIIVLAATKNPIGLAISGGTKAAGELSGKNSLQAAAKQTADAIAAELRTRWSKQGWF